MEETTIALLTRYFNILSATVMGFFAIYGAVTVFFKKSNLNIFRRNAFIRAFCIAALLALALEATVFNHGYYLKYFAGGESHLIGVSPQDSTRLVMSDGIWAEQVYDERSDGTRVPSGMAFKNLNRRITSVYIEPVFDDTTDWASIQIIRTDEEATRKNTRTLFRRIPQDNHIPVHSCGNISEIKFLLNSQIANIALNKQIPLYFSGLRLLVISCLFFLAILFLNKELRAKTAYILFEYKFDPSNRRQNLVFASLVALLLLFSFVCAFTSTSKSWLEYLPDQQYNRFLTDAIINGRTYLDYGNPELMLIAERPYDVDWLGKNGYAGNRVWMADWVYYNGKHYCYFGIVPAIILYIPYKLITGDYLSTNAGIFLFIAAAVVMMAMLWRHCVRRYMPNTNFVFYLLSFLTLFFASGLFVPLRFTRFYSIVSAAGFMFVIAGILLLLKSTEREKLNGLKVFFSCLCLALAVGCRPNLAFVSLIVPAILWKHRSLKLAMIILAPYIMVAIPLCFYNYIRFGSILDFGFKYNMTALNTAAHSLLNPVGKFLHVSFSYLSYLFTVNQYTLFFPFVENIPLTDRFAISIPRFYDKGIGIINFPVVFLLAVFFKNLSARIKPQTFAISSAFLAIAAIMIFLNSYLVGLSARYMIDFAFFMILPSIFCAWHWCGGSACNYVRRLRLKISYVLLSVSILVGLFLFAGAVTNDFVPGNLELYRYLQSSLSFPGII